jgi:hypothetical protein
MNDTELPEEYKIKATGQIGILVESNYNHVRNAADERLKLRLPNGEEREFSTEELENV